MDKISLDNIFGTYTESEDNILDVKNIYEQRKPKQKHILDINKIKKNMEYAKKLIADEYKKKYIICVNRINLANDMGKTNIIYSIYNEITMVRNFKCKDCVEYINKKLLKKKFNTCILSDTSLLISWKNIYKKFE